MTLEWAIMHFGYPAILVGTVFEGEIILILAGFAAHRGYFHLPLVIGIALLGTLIGDQFYFFLGRNRGRAVLAKHPRWNERVDRFSRLMHTYDTVILITFRFMYGLRTIAPFAIGLSNISTKKFVIFNVISAVIWATTIGSLGYLFGQVMEVVLENVKRYELAFMAVLLAIASAVFLIRIYQNRKRGQSKP